MSWRDADLVAVSLFAGVGGIDLGLEQAGIPTAVQVEVDPSCRRVLAARFPDAVRFNDVREVTGEQIREVVGGRRLVLAGGFPCQDVSVAGRRAGMAGDRSSLYVELVRLADELDPDWVVVENVPGLLSADVDPDANGGRACREGGGRCDHPVLPAVGGAHGLGSGTAFAVVLGDLAGYRPPVPDDGWRNSGVCVGARRSVAWRIVDARHFGVAQRRRRVFVVASPRERVAPAAVLLEPEGVRGDPPPGRPPRPRFAEGVARAAVRAGARGADGRGGAGARAGVLADEGVVSSLTSSLGEGGPDAAHAHAGWMVPVEAEQPLAADARNGAVSDDVTGTLQSHGQSYSLNAQPTIIDPSPAAMRETGQGWWTQDDQAATLRAGSGDPDTVVADPNDRVTHALTAEGADASEDGTGRGTPLAVEQAVVPIGQDALRGAGEARTPSADAEGRVRLRDPGFGVGEDGDEAQTLTAAGPGAVATWRKSRRAQTSADDETWVPDEVANTLNTFDGGDARATELVIDAVAFAEGSKGQAVDDVAPTLQSSQPSDSSNRQTAVVQAFGNAGYGSPVDGEVAPTLQATGQEGNQVQGVIESYDMQNDSLGGELAPTLQAEAQKRGNRGAGVVSSFTDNGSDVYLTEEQTGALCSGGGIPGQGYQAIVEPDESVGALTAGGKGQAPRSIAGQDIYTGVLRPMANAQVRRLTPVECSRLQGFPDDHLTAGIDPPLSDSVQYRCLGNAVCVPVAAWVGWRLVAWENGWRP